MSTQAATPRAPRTPTARRPLPSALNVITATLGLFLVVLTLLALQVRAGKDPSLTKGTSGTSKAGASSAASATRQVVTKTS